MVKKPVSRQNYTGQKYSQNYKWTELYGDKLTLWKKNTRTNKHKTKHFTFYFILHNSYLIPQIPSKCHM